MWMSHITLQLVCTWRHGICVNNFPFLFSSLKKWSILRWALHKHLFGSGHSILRERDSSLLLLKDLIESIHLCYFWCTTHLKKKSDVLHLLLLRIYEDYLSHCCLPYINHSFKKYALRFHSILLYLLLSYLCCN